MQESIFFSKFDKIKHFDTLNFLYPQGNLLSTNVENLKQMVDPTQASVTEKEKYQTRSIKVMVDPMNISFEQNFMDEHKSCFHKQLQKYMEHQTHLIAGNEKEKFSRSNDYQSDMGESWTLAQMIRQYGSSMSQVQRETLIIDLKREDKLSEFLHYVLNRVKDDSIKDVIQLANQIWEEYIIVQDMNYTFQETIEFAQLFVTKHFERLDEKSTNINFKLNRSTTQNKQRLNLFKRFLTFFTTTTCLVIGGFFQNPYVQTEQNYFKRDLMGLKQDFLNDDELQEDSQSEDDEAVVSKRVKS